MTKRTVPLACTILLASLLAACSSTPSSKLPPQQQLTQDLPSRTSGPEKKDPAEVAKVNIDLAANYYSYRQYDAALEAVQRAVDAQPENPQAQILSGFIYVELKDMPKAEASFAKAVGIAPNDPGILHNQATFLCRTGRGAEAMKIFDRALSIPTYRRPAVSQAAAGACLMRMDRPQDALARFTEALDSEPMHPQALLGAAEVLVKSGNATKAREYMDRYRTVGRATSESLYIDVQIYRALGMKSDEAMTATDLRSQYPDSQQVKQLNGQR